MTARFASLLPLALLCACGSGGGEANRTASAQPQPETLIPAPPPVVEPVDARIECAVDGAALARVCTLDKVTGPDGTSITVRSPSGGFRRLKVTKDGSGLAAADGAEPARVTVVGPGRIEVAIGGDRYRLPANVRQ